jgi:DNA mismatch endonuclease (patch repair protein)
MADIVDSATRSRMMKGIGSRNTRPEIALRSALHRRGLRFRLHVKELPGKPDLVLPHFRAVIFVHGCFWHRHAGCRFASAPATRAEFWQAKFGGNVARDARNRVALLALGWRVAVVWECSLNGDNGKVVDAVSHWLSAENGAFLEI